MFSCLKSISSFLVRDVYFYKFNYIHTRLVTDQARSAPVCAWHACVAGAGGARRRRARRTGTTPPTPTPRSRRRTRCGTARSALAHQYRYTMRVELLSVHKYLTSSRYTFYFFQTTFYFFFTLRDIHSPLFDPSLSFSKSYPQHPCCRLLEWHRLFSQVTSQFWSHPIVSDTSQFSASLARSAGGVRLVEHARAPKQRVPRRAAGGAAGALLLERGARRSASRCRRNHSTATDTIACGERK